MERYPSRQCVRVERDCAVPMDASPVWNRLLVVFEMAMLEGWLCSPPDWLRILIAWAVGIRMIAIPALVLSPYLMICFGLAIHTLVRSCRPLAERRLTSSVSPICPRLPTIQCDA
jgi:hypothetical protein